MKNQEWYIATVFDNLNEIILYDPVSREKSTNIVNGVYVREKTRYREPLKTSVFRGNFENAML